MGVLMVMDFEQGKVASQSVSHLNQAHKDRKATLVIRASFSQGALVSCTLLFQIRRGQCDYNHGIMGHTPFHIV